MSLPEVLLLTTPTCPHCPGVKQALGMLANEGLIAAPEVVDLAAHPARAQALGVRSVPWFRIGELRFEPRGIEGLAAALPTEQLNRDGARCY